MLKSKSKSKPLGSFRSLVIVESPSKCKKIEEYLGPGYKCLASFGHLTELSSLKNIDVENNYHPTYTIIDNSLKRKQIELLRKEINEVDEIILACDNDREGEAICWNLCKIFNLDIEKTKRILFNEITESALKNAIKKPSKINMDIVHAQQARQILDILVGFKISPLLWKYISQNRENALSAGRCQTPALKLIYDNYLDIQNSPGKICYQTIGYFTNMNLPFELNHILTNEEDVLEWLDKMADHKHIYECSKPNRINKKPPEPLTTSRIQQMASNELHFSPKETMKICQSLYESGYITYMRTDSQKYSSEFIEIIKTYILDNYQYNQQYINSEIDKYKNNNTNENLNLNTNSNSNNNNFVQEAHEAIRPTNISLQELPSFIDSKERRLYKKIWEITLESCMSDAQYNSITASIQTINNKSFIYNSEQLVFPGWKIVKNKENEQNKEYIYLVSLKDKSQIQYKKILSTMSLREMKNHYSEARLVHLLEEKGIGRPSTFSMLVDKIQEKGYVQKENIQGKKIMCRDYELFNDEINEIELLKEFGNEKNKLVIQPLGIMVIQFLEKYFNELFNYDYTKNMEQSLDKIAKGESIWYYLCKECDDCIEHLMESVKDESKFEIKIDDKHSYIISKNGPLVKCINEDNKVSFSPVRENLDFNKLQNGEYTLNEIIAPSISYKENILGTYEGLSLILKKGKYGLYVSWGEKTQSLKELGNQPVESITFEDVIPLLDKSKINQSNNENEIDKNIGLGMLREITQYLSIRKSKRGDYIYFKSSTMKKPSFFTLTGFEKETNENYLSCNINIVKAWIKNKYGIY